MDRIESMSDQELEALADAVTAERTKRARAKQERDDQERLARALSPILP